MNKRLMRIGVVLAAGLFWVASTAAGQLPLYDTVGAPVVPDPPPPVPVFDAVTASGAAYGVNLFEDADPFMGVARFSGYADCAWDPDYGVPCRVYAAVAFAVPSGAGGAPEDWCELSFTTATYSIRRLYRGPCVAPDALGGFGYATAYFWRAYSSGWAPATGDIAVRVTPH